MIIIIILIIRKKRKLYMLWYRKLYNIYIYMIICISWPLNEIYDETISNVHLIMKNVVTYMMLHTWLCYVFIILVQFHELTNFKKQVSPFTIKNVKHFTWKNIITILFSIYKQVFNYLYSEILNIRIILYILEHCFNYYYIDTRREFKAI